jgi:plasmid stabilization system protein ParE
VPNKISFRRAARDDLRDASDWYEQQQTGLGEQFEVEVEKALLRAAAMPESYVKIHHSGTRRVTTKRFPYQILFKIEGAAILVFAVMHQSRDPRRWQSRQ